MAAPKYTSRPLTPAAADRNRVTVSRATVALHTARAEVSEQVRITDTKTTALLALCGAALAGIIALTRTDITLWAAGLLYLAMALVAGSVGLLLSALCRHHGGGPYGFHRWAWLGDADEVLAEHAVPEDISSRWLAEHLTQLSCLLRTKHSQIALAVRLLQLAAMPLAVALPLA